MGLLLAGKKAVDAYRWVKGGSGGSGGAAGGGFADLGVMPVYVVNMPGGGMGGAAGGLPEGIGGDGKPTGKPSAKSKWPSIFSKQNLAAIGTIGYASTMIPEWSPIDVRRASEVDRTGLPESFVPAPGLLDVWDELKGLFSGSSNGSMAGNSYMAGQTGGEMKLKVEVSDDRVKVTPTYLPKGFTIDPDMGAN